MIKKYLIALDQGTTSSRTIVFDKQNRQIVYSSQKPLKQIYPQAGWVEVDLNELWLTQLFTLQDCLKQISPTEIEAIGITNQRETIGIWNKLGEPFVNAISWQCSRTRDSLKPLLHYEEEVRQITGLTLNPYFSASKLEWLLKNNIQLNAQIEAGELMAGTIDTWLLYKLTGHKSFLTDVSNASRTLLFDINKLEWSDTMMGLFNIPKQILPQVKPSHFHFGKTDKSILGVELPINSLIGDQQAALYGHNCLQKGEAELTCGTGGFLLINTGSEIKITEGFLTSCAWQQNNITYCQEAAILSVGSNLEWLMRLGILKDVHEVDNLISQANPSSQVLFMPTLTGYGSPDWKRESKGAIWNLSADSSAAEITKSVVEGIAYRVSEVKSLIPDLHKLSIGGGLAKSDYFCQFLADLINIPISRSSYIENTALGAALMTNPFMERLETLGTTSTFHPKTHERAKQQYQEWKKFVF